MPYLFYSNIGWASEKIMQLWDAKTMVGQQKQKGM